MFGVVVLDGLRPNVVFEYGVLHELTKPVILLKEKNAILDIDLPDDTQLKPVDDHHKLNQFEQKAV